MSTKIGNQPTPSPVKPVDDQETAKPSGPDNRSTGKKALDAIEGIGLDVGLGILAVVGAPRGPVSAAVRADKGAAGPVTGFVNPFSNWKDTFNK